MEKLVEMLVGDTPLPPTKFVGHEGPISDEAWRRLVDALRHNRAAVGVRLRNCGLRCEHAMQLAEVLASNATLECLELPDNDIGELGVQTLVDTLRLNNSTLKSIDLSGNPCLESASQVLGELDTLMKRNRVIKKLPRTPAGSSGGSSRAPAGLSVGVVHMTPSKGLPSPSTENGANFPSGLLPSGISFEVEQRLQHLEEAEATIRSELEHVRSFSSQSEVWQKKIDTAGQQIAAILALVDTRNQGLEARLQNMELWRAGAEQAWADQSKILEEMASQLLGLRLRVQNLEAQVGQDEPLVCTSSATCRLVASLPDAPTAGDGGIAALTLRREMAVLAERLGRLEEAVRQNAAEKGMGPQDVAEAHEQQKQSSGAAGAGANASEQTPVDADQKMGCKPPAGRRAQLTISSSLSDLSSCDILTPGAHSRQAQPEPASIGPDAREGACVVDLSPSPVYCNTGGARGWQHPPPGPMQGPAEVSPPDVQGVGQSAAPEEQPGSPIMWHVNTFAVSSASADGSTPCARDFFRSIRRRDSGCRVSEAVEDDEDGDEVEEEEDDKRQAPSPGASGDSPFQGDSAHANELDGSFDSSGSVRVLYQASGTHGVVTPGVTGLGVAAASIHTTASRRYTLTRQDSMESVGDCRSSTARAPNEPGLPTHPQPIVAPSGVPNGAAEAPEVRAAPQSSFHLRPGAADISARCGRVPDVTQSGIQAGNHGLPAGASVPSSVPEVPSAPAPPALTPGRPIQKPGGRSPPGTPPGNTFSVDAETVSLSVVMAGSAAQPHAPPAATTTDLSPLARAACTQEPSGSGGGAVRDEAQQRSMDEPDDPARSESLSVTGVVTGVGGPGSAEQAYSGGTAEVGSCCTPERAASASEVACSGTAEVAMQTAEFSAGDAEASVIGEEARQEKLLRSHPVSLPISSHSLATQQMLLVLTGRDLQAAGSVARSVGLFVPEEAQTCVTGLQQTAEPAAAAPNSALLATVVTDTSADSLTPTSRPRDLEVAGQATSTQAPDQALAGPTGPDPHGVFTDAAPQNGDSHEQGPPATATEAGRLRMDARPDPISGLDGAVDGCVTGSQTAGKAQEARPAQAAPVPSAPPLVADHPVQAAGAGAEVTCPLRAQPHAAGPVATNGGRAVVQGPHHGVALRSLASARSESSGTAAMRYHAGAPLSNRGAHPALAKPSGSQCSRSGSTHNGANNAAAAAVTNPNLNGNTVPVAAPAPISRSLSSGSGPAHHLDVPLRYASQRVLRRPTEVTDAAAAVGGPCANSCNGAAVGAGASGPSPSPQKSEVSGIGSRLRLGAAAAAATTAAAATGTPERSPVPQGSGALPGLPTRAGSAGSADAAIPPAAGPHGADAAPIGSASLTPTQQQQQPPQQQVRQPAAQSSHQQQQPHHHGGGASSSSSSRIFRAGAGSASKTLSSGAAANASTSAKGATSKGSARNVTSVAGTTKRWM